VFESQGCEYIYKTKIKPWQVLRQAVIICSAHTHWVVGSMFHSDICYSCRRELSERGTVAVSNETIHCDWLHCSSSFDCCYSSRMYHLQDSTQSFLVPQGKWHAYRIVVLVLFLVLHIFRYCISCCCECFREVHWLAVITWLVFVPASNKCTKGLNYCKIWFRVIQ
jgi:hypothetical protein